ncbi:branched-chain amino acid transaminase [Streptomyces sp. Edi2]|uniref:branched-chain amino acid transaminase n=1 Tax=Streptomyces sp. Edi2 TaxID=3162528 RepID=UPI00330686AD
MTKELNDTEPLKQPDEDCAGAPDRHPEWIWRSGENIAWDNATVHVRAVGHSSVSAVFEGLRAYLSADRQRLFVFRLDEHLNRLFASARLCRLRLPYSFAELREAVLELLLLNRYREDVYIRPWAFPGDPLREMLVPADVNCEVVIDTWRMSSNLFAARGCRAAFGSWARINETTMPPRAKAFSNYHNGRLAVLEARENGHDWPILLNERGKVSEGPGACVALVRDGVVITPSITSGVLESVTRESAITLLREADITVEEREVDRTELYLADEVFFLGTAWEILPITSVDGLRVGEGIMGPVASRLEETYAEVVRGESARHKDWLTEVPLNFDSPS